MKKRRNKNKRLIEKAVVDSVMLYRLSKMIEFINLATGKQFIFDDLFCEGKAYELSYIDEKSLSTEVLVIFRLEDDIVTTKIEGIVTGYYMYNIHDGIMISDSITAITDFIVNEFAKISQKSYELDMIHREISQAERFYAQSSLTCGLEVIYQSRKK